MKQIRSRHLLAALFAGFAWTAFAADAVPPVPAPAAAPRASDPTIDNLEGPDAEKGALAARDMLLEILEKKPRAPEYLTYLRSALDPARIAGSGPGQPVAERLISTLGYSASAGQRFPEEARDAAIRLIGIGGESFKKVLREALIAIARAELKAGGSSATLVSLEARIGETGQSPAVLDEVSAILWRVDGKELIRTLVGVLVKGKGRPRSELAPVILILRDRFDLLLSTPEEWEKWWAENGEKSIEVILEDTRLQFRERQADLIRKLLRRIEGAFDPDAELNALADLLEGDPTREVRAAAMDALAAFPDWLRNGKFPLDRNGNPTIDDVRRAALTSRALALLRGILEESDGRTLVSNRGKRRALGAIRRYAAHLEKNPQDAAAVETLILAGLRTHVPEAGGSSTGASWRSAYRDDVLELVKTAGALRVAEGRTILEKILQEEETRGRSDLELLVETIAALGRVQERGVARSSVDWILRLYRTSKDPADKAQREIRKACVTALNLRIEDREIRDEVRRFYQEVLANGEDRTGHLPAILGLGILAKGGDAEAAGALAGILARRSEYEPAEAIAAVDAMAYLGGVEALEGLLRILDDGRDPAFADHVWKKTVSLLKGQGLPLVQWAMSRLLDRAFLQDRPDLSAVILRLAAEPELAPLISAERANAASPEELNALWNATVARARAHEIAGDEVSAGEVLTALGDLAIKSERMKKARPGAADELNAERLRLGRLAEARGTLSRNPSLPPEARAGEILALLTPSEPPDARWRKLAWVLAQLRKLEAGAGPVVKELLKGLDGAPGEALWKDIAPDATSPDARLRYRKALESLEESLGAGAAPPPKQG